MQEVVGERQSSRTADNKIVSEMIYNVSSGTLNPTIQYNTTADNIAAVKDTVNF